MKGRTIVFTAVVVIALVIVIWHQRRERAAEIATATTGSATGSSASGSGSAANEKVRKIEKPRRDALLERIRVARSARTGATKPGDATSSSGTPRPALPALPGTISKDDIRAGVKAVIPLLAECYSEAQERLPIKEGKIVVQMHLTGEPDVGTLIERAEVGGDAHFTADAALVECLQQTMLSVELPPIQDGGTIDVTYPISFAPS